MNEAYWSWILTAVGLTGFFLAANKVWWCWYINIACQGLWMTYALVTEQWGFVVAAVAYTVVFSRNAVKWTQEHRRINSLIRVPPPPIPIGYIDGVTKDSEGIIWQGRFYNRHSRDENNA